jgi:hypothetical protein
VITDRFTGRVLGAVVVVMTLLIDVGCFLFTNPEIRHRPSFPLVVLVPSLPLIALAIYFFRKAEQLK